MQLLIGEISQLAPATCMWEISHMRKKVADAGISARLMDLLARAKPDGLSRTQWLKESHVSTSFFTDLKNGREPGIDKVERLARRAGLRLSELIEGAERPRVPTEDELTTMVEEAEKPLPRNIPRGEFSRAVASGLREQLLRYSHGLSSDSDVALEPESPPVEAAPTRRSTKKSAQG